MKIPGFVLSSALAAVLLAATSAQSQTPPAKGGDPEKGRLKNAMCSGCHGIEGWKSAFPVVYHVPKLGGQQPAYIVSALKQYKTGARNHATMRSIAASLSEQDMADLAAYYAAAGTASASAK